MKNYYIYHIAGIKIGCTTNVPRRMAEQGFTEWEHLETHTDIYEVSDREIELQKEYGLPVDDIPYWKSVENRYKYTSETGRDAGLKGGANTRDSGKLDIVRTKEVCAMGGRATKGIPKPKSACPKCGAMISNVNLQRHIDRLISCV